MPQFARRRMTPVDSPKSTSYFELGGKTMGIAGMGGIGSFIARRAHNGFDMRVIATDPKPMAKPEYVAELHDPTYFEQMAAQVDVLVSAAPHTPQTDRMFNEKVFRSMKPTAYFLNMSRGKLMDDMALVRALKEGVDRRRGSRRLSRRAAASRPSDLRLPERGDDSAHIGVEPRAPGAGRRSVRREHPPLFDRAAVDECGGQAEGLLSPAARKSPRTEDVKVRDLIRVVEADGWRHVRTMAATGTISTIEAQRRNDPKPPG